MAFTVIKARRLNTTSSGGVTHADFLLNTDHIVNVCLRLGDYNVEMVNNETLYTDEVGYHRICTALQMNNPIPQLRSAEQLEREENKEE